MTMTRTDQEKAAAILHPLLMTGGLPDHLVIRAAKMIIKGLMKEPLQGPSLMFRSKLRQSGATRQQAAYAELVYLAVSTGARIQHKV